MAKRVLDTVGRSPLKQVYYCSRILCCSLTRTKAETGQRTTIKFFSARKHTGKMDMIILKLTESEMDLLYDALTEHKNGLYGEDDEIDAVFESLETKLGEAEQL